MVHWYKTLSVHEYRYFLPVFRIWVIFRIRIELFFLCPDRDRLKIRIRSGKILIRIHEKNRYKTVSTSRQICISYLALSTLSFLVRFLQNLIKTSFRCHWFVNGRIRIRVFKVRILIGEKTRIHQDPDPKPIPNVLYCICLLNPFEPLFDLVRLSLFTEGLPTESPVLRGIMKLFII